MGHKENLEDILQLNMDFFEKYHGPANRDFYQIRQDLVQVSNYFKNPCREFFSEKDNPLERFIKNVSGPYLARAVKQMVSTGLAGITALALGLFAYSTHMYGLTAAFLTFGFALTGYSIYTAVHYKAHKKAIERCTLEQYQEVADKYKDRLMQLAER